MNDGEWGALFSAADAGDLAGVRSALDSGADVNGVSVHNKTALHAAVRRGSADVVKLLLERGADQSVRTKDGENATALDVARRKKAVAAERQSQQALATASEIERLLLQYAGGSPAQHTTDPPLQAAPPSLAKRAPALSRTLAPVTPGPEQLLFFAAEAGDDAQLETHRASCGADAVHWRNPQRYSSTALHAAASSGSARCVERLLSAGADPLARNLFGQLPLHAAARRGHAGCARVLLERTPTDAADHHRNTPLHFAVGLGHVACAQLLLDHGASVAATNESGKTPLDEARSLEMLRMLETRLAKPAAAAAAAGVARGGGGAAAAAGVGAGERAEEQFLSTMNVKRLEVAMRDLFTDGSAAAAWTPAQREQAAAPFRGFLRQLAAGGGAADEAAGLARDAAARLGPAATAAALSEVFGGGPALGAAVAAALLAGGRGAPGPAAGGERLSRELQQCLGGRWVDAYNALRAQPQRGPAAEALSAACRLSLGDSPQDLPETLWEVPGGSGGAPLSLAEHAARALMHSAAAARAREAADPRGQGEAAGAAMDAGRHSAAAFAHAAAALALLRGNGGPAPPSDPDLPAAAEKAARSVLAAHSSAVSEPSPASGGPAPGGPHAPPRLSAAELWEQEKRGGAGAEAARCSAVDELMAMVGLEEVKHAFVEMFQKAQIAREQGSAAPFTNLNARFEGNPGTGKTSLARLYASFLAQLGALPEGAAYEETSGGELAAAGPGQPGQGGGRPGSGLHGILERCKEAGGGVVFVDEAYQLNPETDSSGRRVLDLILTHATSLDGPCGKLVFVFAGYPKQLERLFSHNPGLPRRFPRRFRLADFGEGEILQLLLSLLERPPLPPRPPPGAKGAPGAAAGGAAAAAARQAAPAAAAQAQAQAFRPPPEALERRRVDQWGNAWYPDLSARRFSGAVEVFPRWVDAQGNSSLGPSPAGRPGAALGSRANPVVTPCGRSMALDGPRGPWRDLHDFSCAAPHAAYPRLSAALPERRQAHHRGGGAAAGGARPAARPAAGAFFSAFRLEDDRWARVAARRLARLAGTEAFGNAGAVLSFLEEEVKPRQAARLRRERAAGGSPDVFLLTRDDLLGPKATKEALERSAALAELRALEGLAEVKADVEALLEAAVANGEKEDREEPLLHDVKLHRVFVGNPGTGKTTVARLYGRVLADIGLLSRGEVLERTPADFVGAVQGASEQQTRAIVQAARGSVLLIDEAYNLYRPPAAGGGVGGGNANAFGAQVLDTLVELIPGNAPADFAVVMLGYQREMDEMFNNSNPGLARRMRRDRPVVFADYDDQALVRILRKLAQAAGAALDLDTAVAAVSHLARARALPHFGNAGAARDLLGQALMAMDARLRRGGGGGGAGGAAAERRLLPEDFAAAAGPAAGEGPSGDAASVDEILLGLVGCESVRELARGLQNAVRLARRRGDDPRRQVGLNFLLLGSPGAGKTTVARLLGRLLRALGLLPFDEVVEVDASKLQTGFAGQAGRLMTETLARAKGKVLFIDEAYALNPKWGGTYMSEVVDTLVAALTHPDFEGKLAVVLAGYELGPKNIYDVLRTNAGLSGRFTETIRLPDLAPGACAELLGRELAREYKLRLSALAAEAAPGVFARLAALPGWANGRDVKTLARKANQRHSNRVAPQVERGGADVDDELISTLCAEDLLEEARAMEAERVARAAAGWDAGPANQGGAEAPPAVMAAATAAPPPPAAAASASAVAARRADEGQAQAPDAAAAEEEEENEDGSLLPVVDDLAEVLGPSAGPEEVRRALEECAAGRPRGELLAGVAEAERAAEAERLREEAEAALRELEREAERAAGLAERRRREAEEAEALAREREELREKAARAAAEAERRRLEEQAGRVEELRRRRLEAASAAAEEEAVQRKLRACGVCVQGFPWVRREGGWQCRGGSHFVSDNDLAAL